MHANPFQARAEGFIVSRYEAFPGTVPTKAHFGMLLLGCDGKFSHTAKESGGQAEE